MSTDPALGNDGQATGVGRQYVLVLSCPDRRGIVHAVASFLLDARCNILDSQQFGDADTGLFFMRVHAEADAVGITLDGLRDGFRPVGEQFGMDWRIEDAATRMRVLIMVSKFGHCLNDLLFRYRTGALPIEIPAVVSNHDDLRPLVASYGIPFHHLPVRPENRAAQEELVLELADKERIDLVVLARYMQVLSDRMCTRLRGQVINIHHSFLPSFKGARPYHQAHDRGVKLIGATAHYVTPALDEGPIIEQDVERVDHAVTPDGLVAVGRDVECQVLARAVRWHTEHRVLLNGHRTVVFT